MPDKTLHGHRDPLHDYRSRTIYLITIKTAAGAPRLAEVVDGEHPYSAALPAGEILTAAVEETLRNQPQIDILEAVLMPDHAHFVFFVKAELLS